jgi:predicted transcriptional regulator
MGDPIPTELDAVVAERGRCLQSLVETPRRKRDLADLLGCSKSTVTRALRDLGEAGLVERRDGEWTATRFGRCVVSARDSYLTRLSTLSDAASLLDRVPADSPIDRAVLDDCDVFLADSSVPDIVVREFLDRVETATRLRIVTPTLLTGFARECYERLAATDDYALDLVAPGPALERVAETYPDVTDLFVGDDAVTVYRGEVPLSFGVWLADDHVGVLVFADRGIAGLVVNDTESATDWAETQYDRVRSTATPLTPPATE